MYNSTQHIYMYIPWGISFDPGALGPPLFLNLKKLCALLSEGVVPEAAAAATGGGAGWGVLFLGVVLVGLWAELLPLVLVGVVCLFPGGGVVPCLNGDFFVLDFDPCLVGDALGGVFAFFFSTVGSAGSSSSPKYLTPPLVPLLVVC